MTDDTTLEARARRRVSARLGFYRHALVFVVVNAGLWALDLSGGGPHWAMWTTLGWGIGLAAHGIATWASLRGEGVRERMLAQEMERLREREPR